MKSRFLICFATILLLAALRAPLRLAAQQQPPPQSTRPPHYKLTMLENLPGGTQAGAQGINNKGQVAGFGWQSGNTEAHAVIWSEGVITDLGTLEGGPFSGTFAYPNQKGEISGFSNTSTPDPNGVDFCFFFTNLECLGFLWRDGVLSALPTLGGNNSYAYQVNDREQVVGLAENTTQDPTCTAYNLEAKPVIWHNGAIQELPTIPGDPDGFGYWINNLGQIVGATGTCNALVPVSSLHAVLWPDGPNGRVIDLGNLGGAGNNIAFYINNQGQVVGMSGVPGGVYWHAFLWTKGDRMQDLGTLPGDVYSWASDINSKNQAVGTSFPATGAGRAFIWQSGVITDLNALIPAGSPLYLLEAFGITDREQIAGFGQLSNGDLRAYLLNPCTERDKECEEGGGKNAVLPTRSAPHDVSNRTSPPSPVRRISSYHFPGGAFGARN